MTTSYGLPGFGVATRTVYPNSKCEGCLHYFRNEGLTGLCGVGLQPATCGEGDYPAKSYAPMDRSGYNTRETLSPNGRTPGDPGDLEAGVSDPAGREATSPKGVSMEHHDFAEIAGGEERLDRMVKSHLEPRLEKARYGCPAHQSGAGRGSSTSASPFFIPSCTCLGIDPSDIARAVWGDLPNRVRARTTYEACEEWVGKAMLPVKAPQSAAKKPPGYLPGVHSPSSPMRPPKGDMGKIFATKPKKPAAPPAQKPGAAESDMESVSKALDELESLTR